MFYQINAALMSIRDFQRHKTNIYDHKFMNGSISQYLLGKPMMFYTLIVNYLSKVSILHTLARHWIVFNEQKLFLEKDSGSVQKFFETKTLKLST